MRLVSILEEAVRKFAHEKHQIQLEAVEIQATKKGFEGDLTVVVFPLLRHIKAKPTDLADALGAFLQDEVEQVDDYNVVQGFLNLSIQNTYYIDFLQSIAAVVDFGFQKPTADSLKILVEYSSPNTNKPLHLGHVRNNLLGASVAKLLEAAGNRVHKTQIINDKGIHICKSMVAWQQFGKGETPESTGSKGDALVGKYYVAFDQQYKKEIQDLQDSGLDADKAKAQAPIMLEAQKMLRDWEAGDAEVRTLWSMMNQWVYDGFADTYNNLGVDFDSYYYESDTYLLGKDIVATGLEKGVFFKKDDGSVWIDLTDEGLDEKIVLRADGTSVYMTQDLGTALLRFKDNPDMSGMVYTVGNEQDYHFKVLFLILKKLGYDWAHRLHHLSYGMVDLPSGKMKSREGTVVDADALMVEMKQTAADLAQELGKLDGFSDSEKDRLYHQVGMGALKYYILKVDPVKRIMFDPQASVDFNGNTGPFIQYTYARIQSILNKAEAATSVFAIKGEDLHPKEKEVIKWIEMYPETVAHAAIQYSPALIANYVYELVKRFNSYYQQLVILDKDEDIRQFRLVLARKVGELIYSGMELLGIECPKQM
ncbi:MAG: arginine--tRNA ligase [Flavobacteriaceae bacterium]